MSDETERRTSPRASLFSGISIVLPDGTVREATAFDIGRRGISIWAEGVRPQGAIRLTIPLADGGPDLVVEGHVVREFESDGGAVWGIEFTNLAPADADRITRFVEATESGT